MFDYKHYAAFYVEIDTTYHVVLCPFIRNHYDADKQAAAFLRGHGLAVYHDSGNLKLKDNLPGAKHYFSLCAESIKLYLRTIGERWDFCDYKIFQVEKSRLPDREHPLWRAMAKENAKAYKRRELKSLIPIFCVMPE